MINMYLYHRQGKGRFAKIIRKKTGYDTSHVGLAFKVPGIEEPLLIEADYRRGVIMRPFRGDPNGDLMPLSDDLFNTQIALQECLSSIGLPYDWDRIARFTFKGALVDEDKEFICSELVAHALNIVFKSNGEEVIPSPGEVHAQCAKLMEESNGNDTNYTTSQQ